jgi:hypothetical protein
MWVFEFVSHDAEALPELGASGWSGPSWVSKLARARSKQCWASGSSSRPCRRHQHLGSRAVAACQPGCEEVGQGLGDRRALLADLLGELEGVLVDGGGPLPGLRRHLRGIGRQHPDRRADVGRVAIGHVDQCPSTSAGRLAPAGDQRIWTASIMSLPLVTSRPSGSARSVRLNPLALLEAGGRFRPARSSNLHDRSHPQHRPHPSSPRPPALAARSPNRRCSAPQGDYPAPLSQPIQGRRGLHPDAVGVPSAPAFGSVRVDVTEQAWASGRPTQHAVGSA